MQIHFFKAAPLVAIVALATAGLAALPQSAQALTFRTVVNGTEYDVTTITDPFRSQIGTFQANPWWGNQSLAADFALAVGDELGLSSFGSPGLLHGPFFAFFASPGGWAGPGGAFVSFSQNDSSTWTQGFGGDTGYAQWSGFPWAVATAVPPTTPDSTPIPTPALLPGLIGMGVAALRKRNQDEGDSAKA